MLIGVRKTSWSATTGFTLNDIPTKILGAANHQDFAGVGVAVPDSLQTCVLCASLHPCVRSRNVRFCSKRPFGSPRFAACEVGIWAVAHLLSLK